MVALAGLRVLNLAGSLSAAWCARTLADYGADVVTVEPPGGAALRRLGPFDANGESIPAAYALANQRSALLELGRPADRAALVRLAGGNDVVIEGGAPGVLEAAGSSFEELRRKQPGLILAALTPHGISGPRAGRAGNDLTAFALSGWAAINGREGQPPLKGVRYVASLYAGLSGAAAILAALRQQGRSGRGQLVDVAETDALATTFASVAAHAQYQGELEQRRVVWFQDPLEGPIPAADGYFHLMLGRSDFFRLAMHVLALPAIAEDARLDDRAGRLALAAEWVPQVRERIASKPKLELFDELATARVVAGPLLTVAELAESEHLAAREFFVRPERGGPRMPGPAARLSASPARLRRAAPQPGADSAQLQPGADSAELLLDPDPSRPRSEPTAEAPRTPARGAAGARADAGLGRRALRSAARAAGRGGDQDRGAPSPRHLARRLRDADPRGARGGADGTPRLELPPLVQLREPQPARCHPRSADRAGHRAAPPAAALDRRRGRELHAAGPRHPRHRLRGDARHPPGRDPLLHQRLRRLRPLPRPPLERRHDRARLGHVVAARFPRRAAPELGRDLPRPARGRHGRRRHPRRARAPRPHGGRPAHRRLDARGVAGAHRRRGAPSRS